MSDTSTATADAQPIDRGLTIHHVAELKPRLQEWLQAGGTTLSLARADECDCAGLQLLIAARRWAQAAGRNLVFTDPGAATLDALRRTGLDVAFAH